MLIRGVVRNMEEEGGGGGRVRERERGGGGEERERGGGVGGVWGGGFEEGSQCEWQVSCCRRAFVV